MSDGRGWIRSVWSEIALGTEGRVQSIDEESACKMFWSHFGCERPDNVEHYADDLLFFVSRHSTKLQVCRHDGLKRPILDAKVDWLATLLLNFVCQMTYQLRICACYYYEGRLVVKSTAMNAVYASPVECIVDKLQRHKAEKLDESHLAPKESFPRVYFAINDFDSCFEDIQVDVGEVLIVELAAVLESTEPLITGPKRFYEKIAPSPITLPIFQGAVTYDALLTAYEDQHNVLVDDHNLDAVKPPDGFVMMTGPYGVGEAQVHLVTDSGKIQGAKSTPRPFELIKELIRSVSSEFLNAAEVDASKDTLHPIFNCRLTFIRMHWLDVAKSLFPRSSR
jgi:hypothetical protein